MTGSSVTYTVSVDPLPPRHETLARLHGRSFIRLQQAQAQARPQAQGILAVPPRASPNPAPAPAAAGRRGRKPRRHEAPADADAARPASPPRRGEPKPVANGGDALAVAVSEAGPASWDEVVRVVPCMDAVVKVFCVHTEPNFSLPWQRKRQYSSSSSGFIIGGRRDAVTVVGYPIGGDTISVTSGVVSRIEILSYVHGSTELLGLQDYEKSGEYTGFPILGIEWQKMENPDLRKSMGMKPDQKGVRVRRVEPTAPESGCLQPSDIILSFDGVDIANDGTVPFRHGERIGFSYLVSQKYTGEKALVKVLRDSKVHEFKIRLATHKRLVAAHVKGRPPSYYIVAGFVFAAVSVPYLRSEILSSIPELMFLMYQYGKDYEYDAPVKLLVKHLHAMAESPDEQLVVVSQVLVADINIGYEEIVNTQVLAFNGQPVKNLKNLIVVLETKTAKAATQDILTTHCIPCAMSDDLKA
ncbi:hypothetical protein HU200_017427 [Digitaria exilis]|uniref:Protease Do-like PDZ domain-containing protein n=1 Tax=Digitaria exilis TaxID=1010633 RepID=A0A835F5Z2_9POAL|nr:hypothetical protein HU200_017427 [Digitaria exilis]